jgi:hypothetical protein
MVKNTNNIFSILHSVSVDNQCEIIGAKDPINIDNKIPNLEKM